MAVTAGDALLETPRTRRILKHFEIVIGFEDENVGGADAFQDAFRRMAKIREEADVAGGRAQEKPDGVRGVVRNVERLDEDIADFKALAGFKEPAFEAVLELELGGFAGEAVAVDGDVELLAKGGKTVDVVGMLVGDEDAGETLGSAANERQTLAKLAQAEPGIDEDAGFFGFQIGAIAAGTAAQNREANGHRATLDSDEDGGNVFPWKALVREDARAELGDLQQHSFQLLKFLLELEKRNR